MTETTPTSTGAFAERRLVPQADPFDLVSKARSGRSLLPLIGAGFSAAAGVPIISHVYTYLLHCLAKVAEEGWYPDEKPWPPVADAFDAPLTQDGLFERLRAAAGTPGHEWLTEPILNAAVGATHDWREILRFLSRLRPVGRPETANIPCPQRFKELELGTPSGTVADSLFEHLAKGCEPGLAHVMLAYLADSLRIRTILTTNFDRLLERAFEAAAMPLEVFEVQRQSELPKSSRLAGGNGGSGRALVKMHGDQYSVRADYSLDELPSRADERTFGGYISDPWRRGNVYRDVLVMGVGGKDRRTVTLLASAMSAIAGFQVYWVCFSETGAAEVRDAFARAFREAATAATPIGLKASPEY